MAKTLFNNCDNIFLLLLRTRIILLIEGGILRNWARCCTSSFLRMKKLESIKNSLEKFQL